MSRKPDPSRYRLPEAFQIPDDAFVTKHTYVSELAKGPSLSERYRGEAVDKNARNQSSAFWVSARVDALREFNGVTKTAYYRAIGITNTSYQNFLNGVAGDDLTKHILDKVSLLTKCDKEWLLDGTHRLEEPEHPNVVIDGTSASEICEPLTTETTLHL